MENYGKNAYFCDILVQMGPENFLSLNIFNNVWYFHVELVKMKAFIALDASVFMHIVCNDNNKGNESELAHWPKIQRRKQFSLGYEKWL